MPNNFQHKQLTSKHCDLQVSSKRIQRVFLNFFFNFFKDFMTLTIDKKQSNPSPNLKRHCPQWRLKHRKIKDKPEKERRDNIWRDSSPNLNRSTCTKLVPQKKKIIEKKSREEEEENHFKKTRKKNYLKRKIKTFE